MLIQLEHFRYTCLNPSVSQSVSRALKFFRLPDIGTALFCSSYPNSFLFLRSPTELCLWTYLFGSAGD